METKVYKNSNGIYTEIFYDFSGEKYINMYYENADKKAVEFAKARLEKREAKKKNQVEFYAKKSLEKVNELLDEEWWWIRVRSDYDWSYSKKYKKLLEMKSRILKNFN